MCELHPLYSGKVMVKTRTNYEYGVAQALGLNAGSGKRVHKFAKPQVLGCHKGT